MTLVERLRACSGAMSDDPECNCLEAAAEIERLNGIMEFAAEASRHERDGLRAEVARLRVLIAIRKCAEHALEHKP